MVVKRQHKRVYNNCQIDESRKNFRLYNVEAQPVKSISICPNIHLVLLNNILCFLRDIHDLLPLRELPRYRLLHLLQHLLLQHFKLHLLHDIVHVSVCALLRNMDSDIGFYAGEELALIFQPILILLTFFVLLYLIVKQGGLVLKRE